MNRTEKHLFIAGRVQGVGFREFTRRSADRFGICGWVRNIPDGRVEALLQGEAKAVGKLLEELRKGPPLARVDELHVESREMSKKLVRFRILD